MKVRRPIRGKPNFRPETINPVRPGFGPPQTVPGPDGTPIKNPIFNIINPVGPRQIQQPGMQQPIPRDPGYESGPIGFPRGPIFANSNATPFIMHPAAGGIRPGDPRTGAPMIPGNRMQEMMRTAPAQQTAPVQPVPAMKKGGVVRGGRAETKGTRPAKLY